MHGRCPEINHRARSAIQVLPRLEPQLRRMEHGRSAPSSSGNRRPRLSVDTLKKG